MEDRRNTRIAKLLACVCALFVISASSLSAQQPEWIWSPKIDGGEAVTSCFFRKKFTLIRPEKAEMIIAAGDRYKLFINGRLVKQSESFGATEKLDISSYMQAGVNLIAVSVDDLTDGDFGLAIRFRVLERGEHRWRSLSSDDSWKTRTQEVKQWQSSGLNDLGWLPAAKLDKAQLVANGSAKADSLQPDFVQPEIVQQNASTLSVPVTQVATAPPEGAIGIQMKDETGLATTEPSTTDKKPVAPEISIEERFQISPEFKIDQIIGHEESGSLISMEFNEFGKLLLSKEGGPLMIADPSLEPNAPNRVRVLCDEVTSCQGILPLNGRIYVTAQGPQGTGLYRLNKGPVSGKMVVEKLLMKFAGKPGEHGPHGISLGPDGMIYVVLGNASQVETVAETSPYKNSYEGDMIPRYEDPGGHAQGIQAPGGTIVRVSLDGSLVERVAGGIRNAYDLVFDENGELFIHDSDMEADEGMTWYRPTSVFHVPAGAEIGWRSGWSKFPSHWLDQTPAVCKTGRGSPAGAVLYQHMQFPVRYQNTIFLADWSEGRILALKKQRNGASYVAKAEEFLKGKPLNVTDLSVGEDGGLYFCTGGRGTSGGVFRITWRGDIPDQMLAFDNQLTTVIRHPQPNSPWARQNIANLKMELGSAWNESIEGVAKEKRNPAKFRISALNAMVMYGPFPSATLLKHLSMDGDAVVRAKIAYLCGISDSNRAFSILEAMLEDQSVFVRRAVCEAMLRSEKTPDYNKLKPMLISSDRVESMTARRILERIPVENWFADLINGQDKRLFIQGAMAASVAAPELSRSYSILAQSSKIMDGFVTDTDFIDLLRVVELSLKQLEIKPESIPAFVIRIQNEFPSNNSLINRELANIMAYLNAGSLDGRLEEYLTSHTDSAMDKVHVAMQMQTIGQQLSESERLKLIGYLEEARHRNGGGSYQSYLSRAVNELCAHLTPAQARDILRQGNDWPNAIIASFFKLPSKLDAEMIQSVISLDQRFADSKDPSVIQMRLGVIAILGQTATPEAMEYLRNIWRKEPARRADIAIGLSQDPTGENWAYLISSLPVLDDTTSHEILAKLANVSRRPKDPVHYKNVIQLGYRLGSNGATKAATLLEHWSGEKIGTQTGDWSSILEQWKQWYEVKWPQESRISTEVKGEVSRVYKTEDLIGMFASVSSGDHTAGRDVFTKAQCVKCHRLGDEGLSLGPDLNSLANRFSNREIVESIINPSAVVSDQYRSKTILTKDGQQFVGMTIAYADGSYVVLDSQGERIKIAADAIDQIKDNDTSSMPANLLDGLSEQEISSLFAYLKSAGSRQSSNVHALNR